MKRDADSLFSPSFPFHKLLCEQARLFAESAAALAAVLQDGGDISEKCSRVHAVAGAAEAGAREVARQLSLTFLLPRDRDDIHELNLAFSSCIQAAKAVAVRVGLYGLSQVRGPARELAADIVAMASAIEQMLRIMNRGQGVEAQVRGVAQAREEADRFLLVGLGELYELPASRPEGVLEIVKWSHVYDRIEAVIDRAERVAQIIEGIALKRV
ncbi:MAG: DUF47 family protein [Elusimicrobia bacterium]|nr:DUF47 family protein [Elusimicrobiota bacterium]